MTFAIVVFTVLIIPVLATAIGLEPRWQQAAAPDSASSVTNAQKISPCRQLVALGFLTLPFSACLLFSHDTLIAASISPMLLWASIGYVLLGLLARHLDDPGLTILFLTISVIPVITRLLVPQNVLN